MTPVVHHLPRSRVSILRYSSVVSWKPLRSSFRRPGRAPTGDVLFCPGRARASDVRRFSSAVQPCHARLYMSDNLLAEQSLTLAIVGTYFSAE